MADWAEGYRRVWEANFQRLDALLAKMKSQEAYLEVSETRSEKNENKHEQN